MRPLTAAPFVGLAARLGAAALFLAGPVADRAHADEMWGRWVPANGAAFTLAEQERLREDGGICMELVNKKAAARATVFRPGDEADAGIGEAIEPVFLECMTSHRWEPVDDVEFQARRVLGAAEDCLLGLESECADMVNQYVHGSLRYGLGPTAGLELGRTLCRRGDGEVCLTMSSLYLHTTDIDGLQRDPGIAVGYAQQGCDHDSERACAFAGMLLGMDIDGLRKDEARSRRFLQRSCELGNTQACQPEPPPETALPASARWCRYGLAARSDELSCPKVEVGWISVPTSEPCLEQIDIVADRCKQTYLLGAESLVQPGG